RVRPPAVVRIQIRAAGETGRELRDRAAVAPPEAADAVAVAAVPLRPQDGKVADLIPALPQVPRLGNQLHLREHRILMDDVEECSEPVDVVQLPGERAREAESEPVDVQ